MKLYRFLIAATLAAAGSGCGSITRGTTEPMAFVSDPPGAQMVTSAGGYACPATPCTLDVGRADEFDVSFTKAGYRPQVVPVRTKVAGTGVAGMAGNVVFGGIIGIGVDAATGAALDHFPNPVSVSLVPEALPSAGKVAKRGRDRATPALPPPGPGM